MLESTALAIMGVSSAISGVAGVAAQAFGSHQKNQSAQRISDYNAKLSEYNSQVALNNAKVIEQSARLERDRGAKKKETLLSQQRAYYAKAGVLNTGSPFEVAIETASEFELDLQIEYWNAQVAANAQIAQSRLDKAQANIARAQALLYGQMKIVQPVLTIAEGVGRVGYQAASLLSTRNPNTPGSQQYAGGTVRPGDYSPYGG